MKLPWSTMTYPNISTSISSYGQNRLQCRQQRSQTALSSGIVNKGNSELGIFTYSGTSRSDSMHVKKVAACKSCVQPFVGEDKILLSFGWFVQSTLACIPLALPDWWKQFFVWLLGCSLTECEGGLPINWHVPLVAITAQSNFIQEEGQIYKTMPQIFYFFAPGFSYDCSKFSNNFTPFFDFERP